MIVPSPRSSRSISASSNPSVESTSACKRATEISVSRLEALVESTDGFELAEIDLELRGEGTIMGERQKGRSDLKLASLRRDRYWVEKAREDAFSILDADPGLQAHDALRAEVDTLLADDETDFLLKS